MALPVVLIHRSKSIPTETSIDKGAYFTVFSFESTPQTTCINLNTQETLTVEEAIRGARYGRHECRVSKEDGNSAPIVVGKKQSVYRADNTLLAVGIFLGSTIATLAAIFGK